MRYAPAAAIAAIVLFSCSYLYFALWHEVLDAMLIQPAPWS